MVNAPAASVPPCCSTVPWLLRKTQRAPAIAPPDSSTTMAQSIKCLRRRYIVKEMEIDVEKRGLSMRHANEVRLPQFVE